MSGVTVSYSGGNIIVNGNTVADTRSFYSLGLDNPDIKNNDNDVEFAEEQKHLRALDGMKDGKIKHNISGYVYDVMYPGLEKRSYDKLSDLVGKFMAGFANKTTRHTWTKVSKNSPLATKLPYDNVFQDSGLDPKSFIDLSRLCGNFGTWADPGYRDEPNYFFPENNGKLVLAESFLELFGLPGCSVEAKKRQGYRYEFAIHTGVDGFVINSPNEDIGSGNRVEWFRGNKYKNELIKQLVASTTIDDGLRRQIIDGLLKAKGMGDLLMILLMFIWKLLHPSQTYTMGTCDYVVDLQCKIIGVNCCTTRAVNKNGIVQLLAIENFEPDGDTPEKAKLRFATEKAKILATNEAFIAEIAKLRGSPDFSVYIYGYNTEFNFSREFYEFIFADLRAINGILATISLQAGDTSVDINTKLELMKLNFTFRLFIRKSNTKLTFTLANEYTKNSDLWRSYSPTLPNYGYRFCDIGKKHTLVKPRIRLQAVRIAGGVRRAGWGKQFGGREPDPNDFESLEFDYEPVMFSIDGEYKEEYPRLKSDLYSHINSILNYRDIIADSVHYLDEILFHFYLHNEVLYDQQLLDLIDVISNEQLMIEQKILSDRKRNTTKAAEYSFYPIPDEFTQDKSRFRPQSILGYGGSRKHRKPKSRKTKTRKTKKSRNSR